MERRHPLVTVDMMQTNAKNKEQFKLLQYSDDSKSLSDLELTEIVVPRKRKVRRYCYRLCHHLVYQSFSLNRKTKPKNGQRQRKSSSSSGSDSCKNVGVWVAIISNWCWLLILSYIISMIHSEYGQLDKQTGKLVTIVKAFPDSIDELNDRVHSLEVNQSTIFAKIFDLQQGMRNVTQELVQLRELIKQQSQENDNGKMGMLQKNVADFGASLKAISSEIDSIKERLSTVQQNLNTNQQENDYFKSLIVTKQLNSTDKTLISADPKNVLVHELQDLRNTTSILTQNLTSLNSTLTTVESDLTQRIKQIDKESQAERQNFGSFTDSLNNATTHIMSLEDVWTRQKGVFEGVTLQLKNQELVLNNLLADYKNLNDSVAYLKVRLYSLLATATPGPITTEPSSDTASDTSRATQGTSN